MWIGTHIKRTDDDDDDEETILMVFIYGLCND